VDASRLAHPPLAFGVMGSASGELDADVVVVVRRLGAAIAAAGCTLITGACPGIPYVAVEGAKEAGGLVVGISPALSEVEHVQRFGAPVAGFDVIVYTGSGLMGREVVNIRSSDIVVIAGGRSGTLGEFAIAYDEGRLVGVLSGTGGIADMVDELVERVHKETGAFVLYDDDPDRLVRRLIDYYGSEHYRRPSALHDLAPTSPASPAGTPTGAAS
jgi:uncharacterized protein (TIGR00725 family)